jgi:hypothetical protein
MDTDASESPLEALKGAETKTYSDAVALIFKINPEPRECWFCRCWEGGICGVVMETHTVYGAETNVCHGCAIREGLAPSPKRRMSPWRWNERLEEYELREEFQ